MRKKSLVLKGQSLFLIVALFTSSLFPQGALAQEQPVPTEIKDLNDTSFDTSPKEKRELPEHRTERSKRFQNPDGTFTEHIYNQPIHYKDPANGNWLPIDLNLTADDQGDLQNNDPRFKVKLKSVANGGFMSFTKDGTTVSFRPNFAGASPGKTTGKKLQYQSVAPDVDLNYTMLPDGIKEDIVLKSPNTSSAFTFEMKMENLTYQLAEDGSVLFFKTGQSTPLFTMAKPYMVDANRHYSQAVHYNIRKDTDNKLWLDVTADPTWLKDPNRKYPVTIDPPIGYAASYDTYVESKKPGTSFYNSQHNLIGDCVDHGLTRSMYYFDLPAFPTGTVITNATFNVVNDYVAVDDNPIVDIYPINSNWTAEKMTWEANNVISRGPVAASYTATTDVNTADWWNIPMTKLVQDWYSGTQSLNGFELRYRDESKACRQLVSTDYPDQGYHPHLELTYTLDGLGTQSFWTYDGPVNMVNRNLVISATDINYPGRQTALTLKRTYNSRSTQTGVFGYGWSSPLDMSISYTSKGPARFVDDSGTAHTFYQKADGTYEPLSGLNWNLSVSGTTAVITTKEQARYTFSNGRLTKIENANGNALNVYYYANETILQDDASNYIKFTLSGGRVASAQDVAGHVWSYKYDLNNNLKQVISPDDGATYQYRYDKGHNLIASVTPTGKATYYYYNSDDRVVAVNPINAVINSNFEVDSNGDATPDHFTFHDGSTGLAIDSGAGSEYKKAAKLNLPTSGTSNYKVYVSNPIPVDPTKSYTVSANVKAVQNSGSHLTVLSVLAYREDGVYIGELGRIPVPGSTNGWESIKSTMPAGQPLALPSGAHTVYVKIAATNQTGTGTSWFDAVQLEESSESHQFIAGDQYTANIPGMQTARYDGDGVKELYQYNDSQNLTEYRQDPNNPTYNLTTKYSWENNKPTVVTDPKGNVTTSQHDTNGNLLSTTDPTGAKASFAYDSLNNMTQSTGPISGQTTQFTYDNARHQKTSRDPFTSSKAQGHDNFGNKINETNLLGWADNLVDNSGFEGATSIDGTPIRYVYNEGQSNQWSLSPDAVSGNKSLMISASSTNANNFSVLVSDLITVSPTSEYVLAGRLKSENSSGDQTTILALYAYDNSGARIGEIGRITDQETRNTCQRFSVPIRKADLPAGTTMVRIKLAAKNATGTGASFFDNIQLQKNPIDTAYNLLDNSSFERGTTAGVGRWVKLNSNGGTFNWVSNTVYAGSRSLSIVNSTGDNGFAFDQYITYDPKKAYTLTAFVKTDNLHPSVAHLRFEFYKADKSKIIDKDLSSVKVGDSADWKRLFVELGENKAPLETAYIRPVLASGASTGTVYFDNVRLQEEGVTTKYLYDASTNYTRMTQMTDAMGQTTNYQYDAVGNIRFITTPLNFTTETKYDTVSRKTAVISPSKEDQVQRSYNPDGNLEWIRITDGSGAAEYSRTEMTYHPSGLIESITDPNENARTYSYTPAGRLQKIVYPNDESISFAYTSVGQLSNVIHDASNRYTYGYDGNSNISSVWDSLRSVKFSATYDSANRLMSTSNGPRTVEFTRDAAGNVTQQVLKIGTSTVDKTQTIQYNLVNQPISLTDVGGTHKFLFNEHGKLSVRQAGNQMTERRMFDNVGRATQILTQTVEGRTLSAYNYEYDADGKVKSVTDHYGQQLNYEYDANGRLILEKLPSGNTVTYTYDRTLDPLGNRTGREEKHPDGTTVKKTSYGYDKANQLLAVDDLAWEYNKRGYLIDNKKFKFQWDAAGRLISITKSNQTEPFATYQYDHLNRRVQSVVDGNTTNYFYEGNSNRVLAEYDGSGAPKKYFVWGPSGRLLSLNVEGTTYYPVYNGHGDIVQLTNSAGEVVAWYQYDAWGNLTAHSENTDTWSKNPYRYAGYRYDDPTGLYYLNERYYDASVGRFLSADPDVDAPEYAYALNNPVQLSDPSGLRPMCLCEESHSDYSQTAYWEATINAVARPVADWIVESMFESRNPAMMTLAVAANVSMLSSDAKKACKCFTAGTKVLTEEGEKPIEEIAVGDRVLAKDDETGEVAYKEVEWLFQRDVDETYQIFVGNEVISTTDEHPFWIVNKGWVEAKDLKTGEILTTSDGKELPIEKIEVKQEHTTVYNFRVKDFHTYFVSNLKIWTHNACSFITPGSLPADEEREVLDTLSHIDAGTTPSDSDRQKKWGITFRNDEGRLPDSGSYKEFTVRPPVGSRTRGARRIVLDTVSNLVYYTWTHYGTAGGVPFVRIR